MKKKVVFAIVFTMALAAVMSFGIAQDKEVASTEAKAACSVCPCAEKCVCPTDACKCADECQCPDQKAAACPVKAESSCATQSSCPLKKAVSRCCGK